MPEIGGATGTGQGGGGGGGTGISLMVTEGMWLSATVFPCNVGVWLSWPPLFTSFCFRSFKRLLPAGRTGSSTLGGRGGREVWEAESLGGRGGWVVTGVGGIGEREPLMGGGERVEDKRC